MPLRMSIPLPGPFSYSTRIGGKGSSNAAYWLLIGWWLVPMVLMLKWSYLLMAWMTVYAVLLCRGETRPPRINGWRIKRPPAR